MKKKFVVKSNFDIITGTKKRDVFIDDELFEYEIDQESLQKAKQMGSTYYMAAQMDIQDHFLKCLSEFIGREITSKELLEAIQTGWI